MTPEPAPASAADTRPADAAEPSETAGAFMRRHRQALHVSIHDLVGCSGISASAIGNL